MFRAISFGCLVFLFASAGPAKAQSPQGEEAQPASAKVSDQQIDQWVHQLGSDQFKVREMASEKLFELGAPAVRRMKLLRDRSNDLEQLERLERIISLLNEREFEGEIDRFLDGQPTDLEGWPEFEKLFKDTPQVREIFVELYREYPFAVRSFGGSKREVLEALNKVSGQQSVRGIGISQSPQRIDLLALLLPPAISDVQTDLQLDLNIYTLLQLHPANDLRGDPAFGEPFKVIVTKWMKQSHLGIRDRILRIALDWKMDVARDLAIDTLNQNPDEQLLCRAMQALASRGTAEDAERLKPYLDDLTVIVRKNYVGSRESDVLVSDVAAAAIAHLYGLSVMKVGFAKPAEHDVLGIIIEDLTVALEGNAAADEESELEMTEEEKEAWEDIQVQLKQHGMEAGPKEFQQFKIFQQQRRKEAESRKAIRKSVLKLLDGDGKDVPAVQSDS
ncbi:hypothetical protein LOC67_01865 [Stieleria sp. JC731]|uniref:hypothetical protein n=1 Tax=Pirellulaceae TaxID=2691357 RepID=UPI001E57E787|nr:hypothetical protein [Stieleria sp. JC731]MCC9599290.1 hypothetical protein [Stieleria sp. JC731]